MWLKNNFTQISKYEKRTNNNYPPEAFFLFIIYIFNYLINIKQSSNSGVKVYQVYLFIYLCVNLNSLIV